MNKLSEVNELGAGPAGGGGVDRSRLIHLVAGATLVPLTLLVHFAFYSAAGPLFRDDAHEVNFVSGTTFSELIAKLWLDSSPALYKFFLRGWSSFGSSDLYFRTSALLIACLFVGAVVVLFTNLKERRFPVASLALPLLSPFVIEQFDALRPYGLGLLWMALFFAGFLRTFQEPGWKVMVATALCGILAVNTTYHACFFILSLCVAGALAALLVRKQAWQATRLALLGLPPLIGVLPYVPIVRKSSYWIVTQQMPFSFGTVIRVFGQSIGSLSLAMTVAIVAGTLLLLFRRAPRAGIDTASADRGPVAAFDPATAVLAMGTLALYAAVTMASFYQSAILPTPLRFVPLLVMGALCLDVMLAQYPGPWHAAVAAGLIVLSALSFSPTVRELTRRQTNLDMLAETIGKSASADDLILLRSWSSAITFDRYYEGAAPFVTVPDIPDRGIHRYDLLRRKFESTAPHAAVFEAVERTLKQGGRLYLVGNFRRVSTTVQIEPLAPAPHPQYGFYKVPYLHDGEDRIFQFILQHAGQLEFAVPAAEPPLRERMALTVASGWRARP